MGDGNGFFHFFPITTSDHVIPSVPERSEGREGPQVFMGREVADLKLPWSRGLSIEPLEHSTLEVPRHSR